MNVLEFINSKDINVSEFDQYFRETITPIIQKFTNSSELYKAAMLYEASRVKKFSYLEIHSNFDSIVALIVHELLAEEDKTEKCLSISPGSLVVELAYSHYTLVTLEKRGSVQYREMYKEKLLATINQVLEKRSLINQMHIDIIDLIKQET